MPHDAPAAEADWGGKSSSNISEERRPGVLSPTNGADRIEIPRVVHTMMGQSEHTKPIAMGVAIPPAVNGAGMAWSRWCSYLPS